MHAHTHTRTHAYAHTRTHAHTHTRTHTHTHTHTWTGHRSVLVGDSDDDGEANTYDYNDSFIDDEQGED